MTRQTTHVVVLGGGYAGLMAAMRLATKTDRETVSITLVNAGGTFNERVRNHQLISAQPVRELPYADLLSGTRIAFVQATVLAIEPDRGVVIVRAGQDLAPREIRYDHLVCALGSSIDVGGVPGAREHASTLDEQSARALARRLPELAAANGRVLLVGGGNTGVEVATELAEQWPDLQVTVATRRSLASNLSDRAQRHIRRAFDRLHITFLENTEVTRLKRGRALTRTGAIPFDACIWVGGFAVSDLARQAGLRVNDRGQILVDRALRSLSHPNIYAAGDAAMPAEEPGTPVRMSLYAATPMGAHAADGLAAHLNGGSPTAFGLSYIAMGLSLGRRDGVLQFLHPSSDTPFDVILTGRLANRAREFFVWFVIRSILLQRTMPWTFIWPGMGKMRAHAVPNPTVASSEPSATDLRAA